MTFLSDLIIAYRAVRDSRRRSKAMEHTPRESERAAKQAARLALMTESDLRRWAAQHGGQMAYHEARRRGIV